MKLSPEEKLLIKKAKEASLKAYAPYSKQKVGAALLTENGTVYTGCNIENASYSLTICAERNAITKAVGNGEKDFKTMAIYVDSLKLFTPCGACRQFMIEFTQDMKIIYGNRVVWKTTTLAELLPDSFHL